MFTRLLQVSLSKVTLTPTLSGWNSFDIDLSNYTIPLTSIIQFKFVGTPASGKHGFLDDNIYSTGLAALVDQSQRLQRNTYKKRSFCYFPV